MQIEYAKVSALGDRQDNQDRAAVVVSDESALMLVFDGMGGHSDGAKAAETGIKVSLAGELDDCFCGFLLARVYYGEFGAPEPVAARSIGGAVGPVGTRSERSKTVPRQPSLSPDQPAI